MDNSRFMDTYGHLFEHSPWVVERAWALRPFANATVLHTAFMQVLAEATPGERLALIQAHPRLADKVAIAEGLTADSASEQATAGLAALTEEEFDAFHSLNTAYDRQFGFPFVICVKLHTKAGILEAMRARLQRDAAVELSEAVAQVGLISQMRLALVPWNAEAMA